MRHTRKFFVLLAVLAMSVVTAVSVFAAVPGAFDFATGGNPVPDGDTISDFLVDDLTFTVDEPADLDSVANSSIDWYLYEGLALGTPGTDDIATATLTDNGDSTWSFTLPAATVNGLANGDYTWTIEASNDDGITFITGGEFGFAIARSPGAFDFVAGAPPAVVDNGGVVDSLLGETDVTFSVTVPDADFDTVEDAVVWYIDAGETVDPSDNDETNSIDLVLNNGGTAEDPSDDVYDLTIPGETVDGLANGLYTWTIWAENAGEPTPITGAPFTFEIARAPGEFGFVGDVVPEAVSNGNQITEAVAVAVELSVEVPATDFVAGTDFMYWVLFDSEGMVYDLDGDMTMDENDRIDLSFDDQDNADPADDVYDLTIPAADVNGLPNGDYTWDIYASDGFAMDSLFTTVTVPAATTLSFTVDLPAPGAFEFVTGDPPAAVIDDNEITGDVAGDVLMSVTAPATDFDNTAAGDVVTWVLFDSAEDVVDAIDLVGDADPAAEYDLTIPAAAVDGLANGAYTWNIFAYNDNDFTAVTVPADTTFSFSINRPPAGAFDFVETFGPPAAVNGGTIDELLPADVTMSVEVPTTEFDSTTDSMTWYIATDDTVGMDNFALQVPLVANPDDATATQYDLTIPFGAVNDLVNGTYFWTIQAFNGSTVTDVTGAPFSFTVALDPAGFDFTDGPPAAVNAGTISELLVDDVTMSVEVPATGFNLEADTMTWYIFTDNTVSGANNLLGGVSLVYNETDMDFDLTIPAAAVNALENGTYFWTIWAENELAATPVTGAPFSFTVDFPLAGPFDFVTGAEPPAAVNGGVITADIADDVTMSVTVPGGDFDPLTDTVIWYIGADATVGGMDNSVANIPLVFNDQETADPADDAYDLTIPAATVNGLDDGRYYWTIWAEGDALAQPEAVAGAPFDFVVSKDLMPPRITPENGGEIVGNEFPAFTFVDIGEEWYQIYIGWGEDAASPYGYQGLFGWYPAEDFTLGGFSQDGICEAGVCTIPAADVIPVYVGGNENYEWWMTYWSTGDTLADANSLDRWNVSFFDINYPIVGDELVAISPTADSTVSEAPTSIIFERPVGSLWMEIWLGVGEPTYSPQLFFGWVSTADDTDTLTCTETECVLDTSGYTFTDTNYEMWVRIYGPNGPAATGGVVDWLAVTGSPLSFSVDTTAGTTSGFGDNAIPRGSR